MSRRKPRDAPATMLLPHAPSPGGSLLLLSQGISLGSLGCCDAFITPCPPKQPTVFCSGFEVCTPQKPILGADEGQKVPLRLLLSCLVFWAGTESCWRTHSRPLKKAMLRRFTTPWSMSSWYTWTPVSPLSCKN